MSEVGVLDLSGYGQVPHTATKACPAGTKPVRSPYTGRVICVTPAHPAQPTQPAAAGVFSKMISALRENSKLTGPAQALKQVHRGGPTGAASAMALSAKKRLSGERQQTATMSPQIQKWTGVKSAVKATQAGKLAQKDYSPAAVTARKGWMPGCKLVCPEGTATTAAQTAALAQKRMQAALSAQQAEMAQKHRRPPSMQQKLMAAAQGKLMAAPAKMASGSAVPAMGARVKIQAKPAVQPMLRTALRK